MNPQNSIFHIRKLELSDISPDSGFYDALKQLHLESGSNIDFEKAKDLFGELQKDEDKHIYVAVVDSGFAPIVGTATLRIERQFLRNCSQYGVVDNVCTRKEFEGMGVGSSLIGYIVEVAKENNCYKVILNCKDEVMPFYEKNGFHRHFNEMRLDL